ncbi:MAG TPA: AraC family transcriptional regulator [Planctomycetota bacterium]|nr:AraC family transcriptional regulator [Planctomycetota bacterium]
MKARPERILPSAASSFHWKRRRDPRFPFQWHFHPEAELTWIVRSRGRRFVGDHIEDYGDGDLVLLGPGLPHTWCSDDGPPGRHEAVCIQFRDDFLGREFLERPELLPVRRLLERAARGLRFGGRTVREVAPRMDGLERRSGLARLQGLLDILGRLAAARDGRPLASPGWKAPPGDRDMDRLDRVCRFLAERFREDVALADAAAQAHLSAPAFCRFFKAGTGKTFVEYLTELRVGHACRLLAETDRPVTDVAFDAGFRNLSNFNRRFRALRGGTPRAYRAHFRG